MSYEFELDEKVVISITADFGGHSNALIGVVIGRAEYTYCEPQYLLRYVDHHGDPQESWWTQSALEPRERRAI